MPINTLHEMVETIPYIRTMGKTLECQTHQTHLRIKFLSKVK